MNVHSFTNKFCKKLEIDAEGDINITSNNGNVNINGKKDSLDG